MYILVSIYPVVIEHDDTTKDIKTTLKEILECQQSLIRQLETLENAIKGWYYVFLVFIPIYIHTAGSHLNQAPPWLSNITIMLTVSVVPLWFNNTPLMSAVNVVLPPMFTVTQCKSAYQSSHLEKL